MSGKLTYTHLLTSYLENLPLNLKHIKDKTIYNIHLQSISKQPGHQHHVERFFLLFLGDLLFVLASQDLPRYIADSISGICMLTVKYASCTKVEIG
jgi:hypothetical protein